jgi:hypothetical protein
MIISTLAYILASGEYGSPASFPIRHGHGFPTPSDWNALIEYEPDRSWDDAPYIVVPVTSWSDSHGSDYDRSNHRSILRHYADGTFIDETLAYGGRELRIPVFIEEDEHDAETSVHLNMERAEDFARTMVALAEQYPLYDESDQSQLIEEMIGETWDAWLGMDVHGVIRDHLRDVNVDDDELPEWSDETLRDAFWEVYSDMTQDGPYDYPYAETATSVVIPEWERAARRLAVLIEKGWDGTGDVPTHTTDLTRAS